MAMEITPTTISVQPLLISCQLDTLGKSEMR
jgi:hypothetical protein